MSLTMPTMRRSRIDIIENMEYVAEGLDGGHL